MKSKEPTNTRKPYDAIEDAIEQSKKGPTRTWDSANEIDSKRIVNKDDASQNNEKVAARA